MLVWIMTHYKDVLLALLSIDAAIIPIFPNATLLQKIKNVLTDATKV